MFAANVLTWVFMSNRSGCHRGGDTRLPRKATTTAPHQGRVTRQGGGSGKGRGRYAVAERVFFFSIQRTWMSESIPSVWMCVRCDRAQCSQRPFPHFRANETKGLREETTSIISYEATGWVGLLQLGKYLHIVSKSLSDSGGKKKKCRHLSN